MCIRDRHTGEHVRGDGSQRGHADGLDVRGIPAVLAPDVGCLLYTSDAADERSSVDLGGRRIIKKKKIQPVRWSENTSEQRR